MAILQTQTTTYRGPTLMGYLLMIVTWQALFIGCFFMSGCGGGGGDDSDPTPNQFTTNNETKPCGDVTLNLGSPEEVQEAVDEAVADAIEQGDTPVVFENEVPSLQSGAIRVAKSFTIVAGCNNTIVNEQNQTVLVNQPGKE